MRNTRFLAWIVTVAFMAIAALPMVWCEGVTDKALPPLDENVPTEECAVFVIPADATVTRIDGIQGKWTPGSAIAATLLVPEGEHAITWDYSKDDGNSTTTAKDLKTSAVMDAGKMYMLFFSLDKQEKTISYHVGEMDRTAYNQYVLHESEKREAGKMLGLAAVVLGALYLLLRYVVWDKARPQVKALPPLQAGLTTANAATLVFRGFYKVKSLDGFNVLWKTGLLAKAASVLVPPGQHKIVFSYSEDRGGTTHTGIDLSAAGCMAAGKTYLLKSTRKQTGEHESEMTSMFVDAGQNGLKDYLKGGSSPVTYITKDMVEAEKRNSSGFAKVKTGDNTGAIADYTEAIRLNPQNALSFVLRGNVYWILQDWQRALADYTQAITLVPNDPVYFNNRGNVYRKLQDWQHAIADYSEAINLNPKEADYFNNRGDAHYGMQDWQHAIADYTEAAKLEPQKAQFFFNRGCVYCNLKDWQRAVADFSETLRFDSSSPIVFGNRGTAYFNLGDLQHAILDQLD